MNPISYSIVIPHKNIPDLLKRCLDSIPQREDIEVLIIDDNSDPGIVDFEEMQSLENERWHFIRTYDNKGSGFARNRALAEAKGKWLVFSDSDDYFLPGLLEKLDRHFNDDADIIFFDIDSVFSDDLKPSRLHESRSNRLRQYKDKPEQIDLYCRFYYTQPWGKMIRRELVENNRIKFDETKLANDYSFSIKTGYFAKTVKYDDSVLYMYTERKGSLSNKFCSDPATAGIRLDVYHDVQLFLDSHNVRFIPFFEFSFGLWRNGNSMRDIAVEYWKRHNYSLPLVIARYISGKIYQTVTGVRM